MATLTINGRQVTVDDSFLQLSPEQQEATVEEIAASFGSSPSLSDNVDPWVTERANLIESAQQPGAFSDASSSVIGVGLPWADEITGTLLTPIQAAQDWIGGEGFDLGRSFDRSIGLQRELQNRRDSRSPIASAVGGMAGGAALTGPLSLAGAMAPATLAGKVGVGALEGGLIGGLYGSGEGEGGITDRLPEAAKGAALGAAIGGAVPLVASGVSAGYRNIMDRRAANTAAEVANTNPDVARLLTRTLGADETLGPQGAANMARAGNEAMLADAGLNAQGILDTSIQRGGPGATLAKNRINERLARDASALNATLDDVLGVPQGSATAQRAIREGSREAVSEAYNLAKLQPIDYASDAGRQVEEIINKIPSRIKSQAIQRANERMVYEGTPNLQLIADVAGDGSYVLREMPNVAQANEIKKALDSIVNDGVDAVTGKMSSDAQFASSMAKDLRNAVKKAVPEYASALDIAADPLSRQAAVELGSKFQTMRRDVFENAIGGMSKAEKEALAQGIRSQIDDTVANVRRTVMDGNTEAREAYKVISDLSTRANREKLAMAVGEEQAAKLFDELDRVAKSFELQGRTAQGSQTFARAATKEMIDQSTAPGVMGTLTQGKPLNAGQKVAQALTGQTPENILARQDAMYSEIADLLTRPSAQAIPALQATQQLGGKLAENETNAQLIARLIAQGRFAAYPLSGMGAGN